MAPDQSPEANRYRIARLEEDVRDLRAEIRDLGEMRQLIHSCIEAEHTLSQKVDAWTKGLYMATLSITGAVLVAVISVLLALAE